MKQYLLLSLLIFSFFANAKSNSKPNFIIILTDDQGYADLGCFGNPNVKTPHIDQMAAEGAKLSSFYMAAAICTPSRAALMTACYPKRIGMADGVFLAGDPKGLNPKEITIAEVAKSAGYTTGMFGKWHLGDQLEFLPTRQGFDEFFGLPYSHDIHPYHLNQKKHKFPPLPVLEHEKVVETDPDADYLTKRITDRAVDFIKKHKTKPFLMYVAHPIPHRPLHMSPPFMQAVPTTLRELIAKNEKQNKNIDYHNRDKLYPHAISEIDWSVGQILNELKKQGIDENTFVLFSSDNGPSKHALGTTKPYRGNKGSFLEGGVRVPTVVRWPAKIPAGQDNQALLTSMDILPTIANIVGYKFPDDRKIDGKDMLPALMQKEKTPHDYFFYHIKNELRAVRHESWKLYVAKNKATALYDLVTDKQEKVNIMAKHPQLVDQMLKEVINFNNEISNHIRPAATVENPKKLSMAN